MRPETKKIVKRLVILFFIFFLTCEICLRIRLAYLYRNPGWIFYHQFKFRTADEINSEDLPHYYKDNMFKPFILAYHNETPAAKKDIITIESSALRSVRRQLEKVLENNPRFTWVEYSPQKDKAIEFSNNNVILYELFIYPDVYNTLKRESRILKKIFGIKLDDFLYHNFAFYMHIDENVNFTTMNSDKMVDDYIKLLRDREIPFCEEIAKNHYKNVVYILLPNRFDPSTSGGRIYLKYIDAARKAIKPILEKYKVPYLNLMDEKLVKEDFNDYFHFSKIGGRKMAEKIVKYLEENF